jgi:hypothetical protein
MAEDHCPSCGTPYEAEATFCVNCGAKRAARPAEAPAAASAPTPPPPQPEAAAPAPAPIKPEAVAAPTPPPTQPEPVPAPAPTPAPAPSEDEVLSRLDQRVSAAAPPPPAPPPAAPPSPLVAGEPLTTEPRPPKKGKGCCIAAVIGVIVVVLGAVCVYGLYAAGVLDKLGINTGALGAKGFHADFTSVTGDDFTVLARGPGAVVKPQDEMLRVHNALVAVNYDAGNDYTASCLIIVAKVDKPAGWAGLVTRINAKGGDRYAFKLVPAQHEVRLEKIVAGGKTVVLKQARVSAVEVGKPYNVDARVTGNDLVMEINGTAVAAATDIGLLQGPAGLETRDATAYFDDLAIEPIAK